MSLHHLFTSLLHHPHSTLPSVEEEGHVISRRLHELMDGTESEYRKGRSEMLSADERWSSRIPKKPAGSHEGSDRGEGCCRASDL